MKKILIVDDEKSICISLKAWLEDLGYIVEYGNSFEAGKEKIEKFRPHLILLDIKLGNKDGLQFLQEIKSSDESIEVIMMTAYAKISDVVQAVKDGAYNYVSKPLNFEEMEIMILNAFKQIKLKNRLLLLKKEQSENKNHIIYKSKVMHELMQKVDLISNNSEVTVLITGQTGTGKELVAEEIHNRSSRSNSSMVKINCGALPNQLIESELFGHEKNAFTGANTRKKGLLELANEGTVFLDEIGETTVDFQTKLLRVLEERKFRRVGGLEDITIDVRIIAATNKNLKEMIKKKTFRADLYYRLNVFPIKIPSLCDRKEDILILADYYIKKYNLNFGKKVEGLSDGAKIAFVNYSWPGNVRELRNIIERILIVRDEGLIEERDINQLELDKSNTKKEIFVSCKNNYKEEIKNNLEEKGSVVLEKELGEIEKEYIQLAIKKANNNFTKASGMLGMTRFSLKRKYEKYFN